MAKDKKGSKSAVAPKPAASKPIESVKAGRVGKPIESAKKTAKDIAKKVEKTSKKSKRAPTPPSESEESDEDTSDSSASSDDDSEVEAKPKTNGAAKVAPKDDSSSGSEDDSESNEDSDDSEVPAKTNGGKINGMKMNGIKVANKPVDDDDDDDDNDDSSEGSDMEDDVAPKTNGHAKAALDDSDDSDSDSDSEEEAKAGADSDDDSSEASESDEEIKTAAPVNKKRKAEESLAQTPKKTKVTVNGEEKDVSANLFIGNLSFNIDEEWLTREFEEFGQIKGVRVITDRDSGRSKGFGYVEFEDTAHALAAFEAKNGAEMDGRNLRVDFSNPRPERNAGQTPQQRSNERAQRYGDTPKEPAATLFVGNLAFGADENAVTEVFEEYGTIKGVRLITDKDTGDFKGFGYVEMGSIDEAKAAFESLQGADVAGRPIRLDYSTPRPQNESGGRGGFGGRGGGRGGFGDRGGRGGRGRGGFNDRGRGGRGGGRGGSSFNRGGFGDFSGKKTTF